MAIVTRAEAQAATGQQQGAALALEPAALARAAGLARTVGRAVAARLVLRGPAAARGAEGVGGGTVVDASAGRGGSWGAAGDASAEVASTTDAKDDVRLPETGAPEGGDVEGGTCGPVFCFDVFECWIFFPQCGYTACELFACKK